MARTRERSVQTPPQSNNKVDMLEYILGSSLSPSTETTTASQHETVRQHAVPSAQSLGKAAHKLFGRSAEGTKSWSRGKKVALTSVAGGAVIITASGFASTPAQAAEVENTSNGPDLSSQVQAASTTESSSSTKTAQQKSQAGTATIRIDVPSRNLEESSAGTITPVMPVSPQQPAKNEVNTEIKIAVPGEDGADATTDKISAVAPVASAEAPVKNEIKSQINIAVPSKSDTEKVTQSTTINPVAPVATPAPGATPDAKDNTSTTPVVIDTGKASTDTQITPVVPVAPSTPDTKTGTSPDTSDPDTKTDTDPVKISTPIDNPDDQTGTIAPVTPVSPNRPTTPDTPPKSDTDTKSNDQTTTPEQSTIAQKLANATADINNNDLSDASSLLRATFHDTAIVATEFDENGDPTYPQSSPSLVKKVADLGSAYQDVMGAGGHKDVDYVNNGLKANVILDVIARDQSTLSSKDFQGYIADIKRPSDEYLGKLFDQYLDQAKSDLTAQSDDGSAMIDGIDSKYADQVATIYAYLLMANLTDTQQAQGIQDIKDAEAKAAAEKEAEEQRKADEEKKNKEGGEETNGKYKKSVTEQAVDNLLSAEKKNTMRYRALYEYKYFLAHSDYSLVQIAGLVANSLGESGARPDANQTQGGSAKGAFQWEGSRWDNLLAFAATRGKHWTDFDTQLAFVLKELKTRSGSTLKKQTTFYDATNVVLYNFETPWVVVYYYETKDESKAKHEAARRRSLGEPVLDAVQKEMESVQKARNKDKTTADTKVDKKTHEDKKTNNEDDGKAKDGGIMHQAALTFMRNYTKDPENRKFIGGAGTGCDGGPLSNCVSFSMYFVNRFTDLKGGYETPGNGSTVVENLIARNPGVAHGKKARVNAIFSTPSGSQMCGNVKCGHTGVVLGIDGDDIIIGEAACNAMPTSWDTAHRYKLSQFNNGNYTYIYPNKVDTKKINKLTH